MRLVRQFHRSGILAVALLVAVAAANARQAAPAREPDTFGKTCSAETFGHFDSTGTVLSHDPATATTCVVLTTKPATVSGASVLLPVSEIIGRTT